MNAIQLNGIWKLLCCTKDNVNALESIFFYINLSKQIECVYELRYA